MGEARRRREFRAKRQAALQEAWRRVQIADDVRADIARIIRGIDFVDASNGAGGTCLGRALTGRCLLTMLGLPTEAAVGGMVYRAGMDPIRDVVSFCGPGNCGQFADGYLLGHIWLENGHEIIDFSPADWKAGMTRDLQLPGGTRLLGTNGLSPDDDGLGDIQWQVEPPDYLWLPRHEVMPIHGQETPEIGRAWYCGWRGPLPPLGTAINWPNVVRYFKSACIEYDLDSRISIGAAASRPLAAKIAEAA